MKHLKHLLLLYVAMQSLNPIFAAEEAGAKAKALAEAAKAQSEADKTDMTAPAEVQKIIADTVKAYAEAQKFISEAHLNEAKREQVLLEMERLRQRMRITEYEFQRIMSADHKMEAEIAFVQSNINLVRPLVLGRANWKTWVGLETLMEKTGDADIIVQVMFEIKVDKLGVSEFVPNEFGSILTDEFSGGNLGELYVFAQKQDVSFKKFGAAHKAIMKVVAMISKAAELRIRELRDINQSIRLTIAKID